MHKVWLPMVAVIEVATEMMSCLFDLQPVALIQKLLFHIKDTNDCLHKVSRLIVRKC